MCSRTTAARWVTARRVAVNGKVVLDPEHPVDRERDVVCVDGRRAGPAAPLTIMLNKPRGLVTTARDEKGRDTIYECLDDSGLPWLAPVGRLDRASEGLLLLTNDPALAGKISDPDTGPTKRYHVQVTPKPDAVLLRRLTSGVQESGETLRARSATVLREGVRSAWLEVVLAGGRNRQIRRMLDACGYSVQRLVRVAIGALALGNLGKGKWREVTTAEIGSLVARDEREIAAKRGTTPGGDSQ